METTHSFLEVFFQLAPRICNLYALIFLGYLSIKYTKIEQETLTRLSIYFFIPIVMFYGVMRAGFSIGLMLLPLFVCLLSSITCLIVFQISNRFFAEKTKANILALVAGTGNSGYFGIPIALVLFDESGVGVYITLVLGMTLFQNTLGFYITSLGNYTPRNSIKKLMKLPVIYGFVAGVIMNSIGAKLPESSNDFFLYIRGAYIVVGMMIIGAGLATIKKFRINFKFTAAAIAARNLVWPIVAFSGFYLDSITLHIFNEQVHKALLLASLVPIAADSVAIAFLLKCHPEEMASSVLISSLLALVYIPFMISIFF